MAGITINLGAKFMIYFIPLLNAAFGWLMISLLLRLLFHPLHKKSFFIFEVQGFIPKNVPQWGRQAGLYASENLLNIQQLKANLLAPEKLSQINELLDDKVDDFLRNKLKDKIPVFGMFITEGMITKMKETLMDELDEMIPDLIGYFADDLQKKYDVSKMMDEKLQQYDSRYLEKIFYEYAGKGIFQLKAAMALAGLLMGAVEVWLFRVL